MCNQRIERCQSAEGDQQSGDLVQKVLVLSHTPCLSVPCSNDATPHFRRTGFGILCAGFLLSGQIMRRVALAVLLAVLAAAPAHAGAKLLSYGIFSGKQVSCDLPNGPIMNCQMAGVTHLTTATNIPGALGVMFGFNYSLDTGPGAVRTTIIFPPAGLHNPRFPAAHSFATTDNCNGADCLLSYAFDFPWEVVPGVWTFQVWQDGHVVLEKKFNVYLPDQKKGKPGKGKLVASALPVISPGKMPS
jgi:hypothetical protein